MARKLPWRTVIMPPEEGRFTNAEIEKAVRAVMERRERRECRMKDRSSGDGVESPRSREA
ncbi:MAG TPA: hypothetical protein VF092_20375 [Longimicrobium sp.]